VYYDGSYAPFGESYNETGTADRSFTGQNQDTSTDATSGLYDFLFREYRPAYGRWTSPDPVGLAVADLANPQSWDQYAYVHNSPCSAYDLLGFSTCNLSLYISGLLPGSVDVTEVIADLNSAYGSQFSFSSAPSRKSADFSVTSNNDLSRFSTAGHPAVGYAPGGNKLIELDSGAIAREWASIAPLYPGPDKALALAYLLGHEIGHKFRQTHKGAEGTAMEAISNNLDGGAGGLPILPFSAQQKNAIKAQCDQYKRNPRGYAFGTGAGLGGLGFAINTMSYPVFVDWLIEPSEGNLGLGLYDVVTVPIWSFFSTDPSRTQMKID
jgi:RHS repeat-associated protein